MATEGDTKAGLRDDFLANGIYGDLQSISKYPIASPIHPTS
jgi:hypothetical protein